MNRKTVRISAILCSLSLFAYAVCVILNLLLQLLIPIGFILPAGVLLCLGMMLPGAVLLIHGIRQAANKQGSAGLVLSILSLLVGIAWLFFDVLQWVATVLQRAAMDPSFMLPGKLGMSQSDFLSLLSYVNFAHMLIMIVIALCLLVLFVISVITAKQKWWQIKAELHKVATALVLLVPNLLSFLKILLNAIFLNNMGLDMYIRISNAFGYASLAIEVLLALLLAGLILVFGLVFKKQPKEPGRDEDELLYFANLPAGVSADSFKK